MLLSETKCQHFYDKLLYPLHTVESPRNQFVVADYQSLIDPNKSLVVLISPCKMIQTAQ